MPNFRVKYFSSLSIIPFWTMTINGNNNKMPAQALKMMEIPILIIVNETYMGFLVYRKIPSFTIVVDTPFGLTVVLFFLKVLAPKKRNTNPKISKNIPILRAQIVCKNLWGKMKLMEIPNAKVIRYSIGGNIITPALSGVVWTLMTVNV